MIRKILFSPAQIHAERLKQWNWLYNKEVKQKEFVPLMTLFCDPYTKSNLYPFMGTSWQVPEFFHMEFMLTNDHIERLETSYKPYEINFNFNLN